MCHSQMILVVLTLLTIQTAYSAVTMSVTSDMVFSGETATLTCSVVADNGETLNVKQWKDSSKNVIGSASGSFEKSGVSYVVSDLGLSDNKIVNWKIEVKSVTSDSELNCWALVGKPIDESGRLEVVGITSTNTVTVTGESSSVSCLLTGTSKEANIAVQWSKNGSPITAEDGIYNLSTNFTGVNKAAVLTALGIISDETFTCTFTESRGGAVNATVEVDHVTIAAADYNVTGNKTNDGATLSCVLSSAREAPAATKWFRSNGSEITMHDKGFTFYYDSPNSTLVLTIHSVTESTAFTCCFEFAGGTCLEGVAHLEVIREDDIVGGSGDDIIDGKDKEGEEDVGEEEGDVEDKEDGEGGEDVKDGEDTEDEEDEAGDEDDEIGDEGTDNGVEHNKKQSKVILLSLVTSLLVPKRIFIGSW